jgi:hypothetical protein
MICSFKKLSKEQEPPSEVIQARREAHNALLLPCSFRIDPDTLMGFRRLFDIPSCAEGQKPLSLGALRIAGNEFEPKNRGAN